MQKGITFILAILIYGKTKNLWIAAFIATLICGILGVILSAIFPPKQDNPEVQAESK